jgi:hypothetical protein
MPDALEQSGQRGIDGREQSTDTLIETIFLYSDLVPYPGMSESLEADPSRGIESRIPFS